MGKLLGVSLAMLIWGNQALANLHPADANTDTERIHSWAARLNRDYPTLNVRVRVRLDIEPNLRAVMGDLYKLEQNMRGSMPLNPGELMTLACPKIICGEN